jgi:hypothetical protein
MKLVYAMYFNLNLSQTAIKMNLAESDPQELFVMYDRSVIYFFVKICRKIQRQV